MPEPAKSVPTQKRAPKRHWLRFRKKMVRNASAAIRRAILSLSVSVKWSRSTRTPASRPRPWASWTRSSVTSLHRGRGVAPGALKQALDHHIQGDSEGRGPAAARGAGQARRVRGHQGCHQVHQLQVNFSMPLALHNSSFWATHFCIWRAIISRFVSILKTCFFLFFFSHSLKRRKQYCTMRGLFEFLFFSAAKNLKCVFYEPVGSSSILGFVFLFLKIFKLFL